MHTANLPLADPVQIERAHRMLRDIRLRYGMVRIELGSMLALIYDSELWRGKSESFGKLLEAERINANAARQYMRIARKFCVDLGMVDEDIATIALCNMNVLDKAAKVINDGNRDAIMASLAELGERDVVEELDSYTQPDVPRQETHKKVQKLYSEFRSMPDDLQIEFLRKLNPRLVKNHGTAKEKKE